MHPYYRIYQKVTELSQHKSSTWEYEIQAPIRDSQAPTPHEVPVPKSIKPNKATTASLAWLFRSWAGGMRVLDVCRAAETKRHVPS